MTNINMESRIQELELRLESAEEASRSAERLLAIDDIGWERLTGLAYSYDTNSGVPIDILNEIAGDLEDMAITSPLVKRAIQLRHAYVFGRGFNILDVEKPEFKKVITNAYNRETIFSTSAFHAIETAMVTHGNFFLLKTGTRSNIEYIAVPQTEITGVVTHDQDASRILFVKRSWTTPDGDEKHEWIPTNRHKTSGKKLPKSFKRDSTSESVPVNSKSSMFILHNNRLVGHTWGVPLGAAIKIWVAMYTEYLRDNATLTKALSQIAWKIHTASAAAGRKAAMEMVAPKAGGAAIAGTGNDVQAMPRGNDVNYNNGQPLAAMIATAVGVPVIALISSTGASGGAYGAATTLDEPTQKGMYAVQQARIEFLDEILHDLAGEAAHVEFPTMASDATYRYAQSLAQAHATGAIFQDEYRAAVTELLDVTQKHKGVPKPNGFNTWTDPEPEPEPQNTPSDPIARQGNSGAVAGGNDQGDTNHDNDQDRE